MSSFRFFFVLRDVSRVCIIRIICSIRTLYIYIYKLARYSALLHDTARYRDSLDDLPRFLLTIPVFQIAFDNC